MDFSILYTAFTGLFAGIITNFFGAGSIGYIGIGSLVLLMVYAKLPFVVIGGGLMASGFLFSTYGLLPMAALVLIEIIGALCLGIAVMKNTEGA